MEHNLIRKCVEKFAKEDELENVDVEIEENDHNGWMGFGLKLVVSGYKGKSMTKYNIYAKNAPTSIEVRSTCPIEMCFEREIYVYENLIPFFEHLQTELRNFKKVNFIKYYGSLKENSECILLENIVDYKTAVKAKMDDNTLEIIEIIKIIGKIHAFSLVLKVRNPKMFNELVNDMKEIYVGEHNKYKVYGNSFKNMIDVIFQVTNQFLEDDMRAKNYKIRSRAFDLYKNAVNNSVCKVVCHGDCYLLNFLFKYKGDKDSAIEDCKVIDFQLTHMASPAVDFQYLIGSQTSSQQRLQHHTDFTNLHYTTMADTLREFNVDINDVYPKQLYDEDIKNTAIIAIVKANQSFAFDRGNPNNMPTLEDFFSGVFTPEKFKPLHDRQDVEWIKDNIREYLVRYKFD